MAEFVKVAEVDEVPEGAGILVPYGHTNVALFRVAGSFYAIDNTCPHAGGPLADGFLNGAEVTCPWHMWSFDVRSGVCAFDPGLRVASYQVKVEGADILLAPAEAQEGERSGGRCSSDPRCALRSSTS